MKIDMATDVADRVLKQLRTLGGPDCYAVPYINGRERGWTVRARLMPWGAALATTFAENRNSDQIVVYLRTDPYNTSVNHITDEAYVTRTYFPNGDARKAAVYAAKFLRASVVRGFTQKSPVVRRLRRLRRRHP